MAQQGGTYCLRKADDNKSTRSNSTAPLEANKEIATTEQKDPTRNRLLRISDGEKSTIDKENWQVVEQYDPPEEKEKEEETPKPTSTWNSHFHLDLKIGNWHKRLFTFDADVRRYD